MIEIPRKLEDRLKQETKADMLDIMLEAMDSMQAYNGRTITWCIVDALGGSAREDDDGNIVSHVYPAYKRRS